MMQPLTQSEDLPDAFLLYLYNLYKYTDTTAVPPGHLDHHGLPGLPVDGWPAT